MPPQDRMYHILTHYIELQKKAKIDPDNIRKVHLPKFVDTHDTWYKSISKNYLDYKELTWRQFKKELFHPSFALSIVGVTIWARAYHKHVCVFFGYNFLTTHINHDLNKVHIFLLYRGNNRFDETRQIGRMEYRSMYKELTKSSWKIDHYFQKKKEKKELLERSESSSDDESSSHPSDDEIEFDMEQMMEEDDPYDSEKSCHEQDILDSNVQSKAPLHEEKESGTNVQKSLSQELKTQSITVSAVRNKNDERKGVLKAAEQDSAEDVKAEISSKSKEDTGKLETAEDASQEGATTGNVWKNVTITAGKLVNKARLRVKGS